MSLSSFPPTIPCPGAAFPPRGPSGRFPRLAGTVQHSDFHSSVPLRFVFLRSAVTVRAPRSAPSRARGAHRARRGSCSPATRPGSSPRRRMDLPRFLANPDALAPCSGTPVGPRLARLSPRFGVAFNREEGLGSHGGGVTQLNHTARSLAVYASPAASRRLDARLASGCPLALPGGLVPLGSNDWFQLIAFSNPRLSWRNLSLRRHRDIHLHARRRRERGKDAQSIPSPAGASGSCKVFC